MTERNVAPPRRRPKRVLVVRMLVAKLAWLEGHPHWREGRVVWEGPGGRMMPEVSDLARAQRTLTRLRSYPYACQEALGDSEGWFRDRCARLEQAKHLRGHSTSDLPALARQAHSGDAPAIQRLVLLLSAEALCLNALPLAPSAALLACGSRAEAPLRNVIEDDAHPREGRALAALTLGAIHRAGHSPRTSPPAPADPHLRRAYRWGLQAGLAGEPGFLVALLADERGPALAERAARALDPRSPFRLPAERLRELLAAGTTPAQVVALAEAAQSADSLLERLRERRRELPERTSPQRRAVAEQLARQREAAVADLAGLLHAYARATLDPAALYRVVEFARLMLDLGRLTLDLAEGIARPLRRGLDLPPSLLGQWLEILVERHGFFWDLATLPPEKRTRRGEPRMGVWLEERWSRDVRPALQLLRMTSDPHLVREALDRRLHQVLAGYEWEDTDRYRLALSLSRDACVPGETGPVWSLCWMIQSLPDAAAARALLQPVIQAAMGAPPADRQHLLESLLDELPHARQALRDALVRVVRFVPRLLQFAGKDQNKECACGAAVSAALHLDQVVPDQAGVWLDWLLSHLTAFARPDAGSYEEISVRIGVSLGLTVAAGDFSRFQMIVRAAVQHCFHQDRQQVERALPLLTRFPLLRAPLAHLFPRQPQRSADLLVRLGLATRLGPEALAPLAALEAAAAAAAAPDAGLTLDSGWAELLELAPELSSIVAAYRRTQGLRGTDTGVPPGIRRAIELPQRLARELQHLDERLVREPDRSDLSARMASLRARLADREMLLRNVRTEIAERLAQVTAEAQLAAAEQQVLVCYRERLAAVIGPLPAELRFDDDLLNATLLTVDIDRNRRLLLRLLRAHVAGDRSWREQHPANVAFLQTLAAGGADVSAWLAAHPRRYPCPGASGDRVHLRLERDPLRILQMGNHFDTCLSFGGCNSFSTVTNACELNKRVVYARDAAGRVVGRKLIAINEVGGLVGFHTYSSLPDDAGNRALRAIFRQYLTGFAERCRLPLATCGPVPRLFAQDWYDDGIVAWDDDDAAPPGRSGSPPRPLRSTAD